MPPSTRSGRRSSPARTTSTSSVRSGTSTRHTCTVPLRNPFGSAAGARATPSTTSVCLYAIGPGPVRLLISFFQIMMGTRACRGGIGWRAKHGVTTTTTTMTRTWWWCKPVVSFFVVLFALSLLANTAVYIYIHLTDHSSAFKIPSSPMR